MAEYKTLYHISKNKVGLMTPRIPVSEFEDQSIPRICFATSIQGCLIGANEDKDIRGEVFHVYTIETDDYYIPSESEVADVKVTGEVWIKYAVEPDYLYDIRVEKAISSSVAEIAGNIVDVPHWKYTILNPVQDDLSEPSKEDMKLKGSLKEDTRSALINKSKGVGLYKDTSRGRNRFERKKYSKIANQVKSYNQIDMNDFFKRDILKVKIPVIGETDNYDVTIKMEGVVAEIAKNIKSNHNKLEYRTIIQSLTKVFNTTNIYTKCTCLDKNTKIKLLDGTVPTVEEMKTRFDAGEQLYVYSVDENGDFVPGVVEGVYITGKSDHFIEVTLDNGEKIRTTPDHPYLLNNGHYIEAQQLQLGQLLMSVYCDKTEATTNFKPNHRIINIKEIYCEADEVYDIKVKDYHNFLVNAGVILHNCPDHLYNYAHWNIINNVSVDDTAHDPGPGKNIKNPNDDKGRGCKHILLVLSNGDWMMKVASVINNYIHYAEEHMQKAFMKLIFPKLYGMPADEAVENNLVPEETNMDTEPHVIEVINKWAADRGKIKKGSNINPIYADRLQKEQEKDKKQEKSDKKDEKSEEEEK